MENYAKLFELRKHFCLQKIKFLISRMSFSEKDCNHLMMNEHYLSNQSSIENFEDSIFASRTVFTSICGFS